VRPIDFAYLRITGGGEAGARDLFQKLVAQVVVLRRPGADQIEGAGGDWGIDVYVGVLEPRGSIAIWQPKYFMNGVKAAQRRQIEDAFETAVRKAKEEGYILKAWTLCLPSNLTPGETTWWNKFRRDHAQATGITIELWSATRLEHFLLSMDAISLRRSYFDSDELVDPLPIKRPPPDARYDNALFVVQLGKADVIETDSAKTQFFNAELLVREVTDKQVAAEVRELEARGEEVLAIWEPRFGKFDASAGADGRVLHADVMEAIENHHHATRPRMLRAGLIHTLGLMHRAVELGRAGWCRDWRQVARDHAR
jgi:hypothetical protein